MTRAAEIVLVIAGVALIALGAPVLLLEARLLFGWDIWSLPVWSWLGPYPRIVIQVQGAIYFLPVAAVLLLRAGFALIGRAGSTF
jgi:hypothetical protein